MRGLWVREGPSFPSSGDRAVLFYTWSTVGLDGDGFLGFSWKKKKKYAFKICLETTAMGWGQVKSQRRNCSYQRAVCAAGSWWCPEPRAPASTSRALWTVYLCFTFGENFLFPLARHPGLFWKKMAFAAIWWSLYSTAQVINGPDKGPCALGSEGLRSGGLGPLVVG